MAAAPTSASQIVVLLFTDIVDSTALYDRLGDDAAESVRRAHFRLLREAVDASGGHEVKNLGDGLMVVFGSAIEAIRCAVSIQQRLQGEAGPEDRAQARVGLHVGEPIREEDDYFGTPVIIAKRLCDRAAPGEILASELVVRLAGDRADASFAEVGALPLKGLSEPVPAYRVLVAKRAGDTRLPLPGPLSSRSSSSFAGRAQVLAALADAWKRASQGERRVALLGGEPGIGKTRLAAELSRRVHDEGATVLFGRCDTDAVRSYQPFAEMVRHQLTSMPPERRQQLVDAAPSLLELVPEAAEEATAPVGRDADRARLFEAVVLALRTLTERSPLLVVLDDLHWADEPTLVMLRYLLRASETWPLMLVGTYRDTELGRTHPLSAALAELRRDESVERLRLAGLEEAEVVDLLSAASGGSADDTVSLARALFRETEGNPFFLNEMVRHLLETGRVVEEEGALVARGDLGQLDLPEGIKEVVGHRLSRLSGETNHVLSVASVLGTEFAVGPLADLADLTVDDVIAALEEATSARIVDEAAGSVDRFAFAHALIRSTLYEELSSARRLRLHWHAADILRTAGAAPAEVAAHAIEGAPVGDLESAVVAVILAVAHAVDRGAAHEEAIRLADRGLQLLPDEGHDDLRADLLTMRGDAMLRLGDFAPGLAVMMQACEAAARANDTTRLARAAVIAGRSGLGSPVDGIEDWMLRALDALPPGESPERARLVGNLVRLTGDDQDQRTLDALALARRVGDPEAFVYAALSRSFYLRRLPAARERVALVEEAKGMVDPSTLPYLVCELNQIEPLLELGDREEAKRVTAHVASLVEALNLPWRDEILLPQAGEAFHDGRLDETIALAMDVMATYSESFIRNYSGAVVLVAMREQDRAAELLPFVLERVGDPEWGAAAALLEAEAGHPEEARSYLEGIVAALHDNPFLAVGLSIAGDAAVGLGDVVLADEIAVALAPWSGLNVTVGGYFTLGAVDRVLGRLALLRGDLREARRLLTAAVESNVALDAPPLIAQARFDLSLLMDTEGDRDGAQNLRRDVLAAADTYGLKRLDRLAREAGAG